MMTNPIRSFNELLQNLGKDFSGDVLYKKVMEKAKEMVGKVVTPRTITEAGACFGAGTLVHTKDGLKPIEQIQVGDWVLSKPENGEGEQAYKRVARTFSFEDKVVRRVEYAIKRNDIWHSDYLIVTGNHPFWVDGIDKENYPEEHDWSDLKLGWTRADELYSGLRVELPSGEHAYVQSSSIEHLWKTKNPDIAWEGKVDGKGFLINIADALRVPGQEFLKFNFDFHDDDTFRYREENTEWQDKWLYRCKVYNFEVEGFHDIT